MKRSLALLLALTFLLPATGCAPGGSNRNANHAMFALATPVYPEMTPYPDEMSYMNDVTREFDSDAFSADYEAWWADQRAQRDKGLTDHSQLSPFLASSIRQFLSDSQGENRVYSPLNVYMALGMLAELTDGNSRQQILDLLGADSMESLREQASGVWNAHYRNDGAVTSILASSLWLNEDVTFEQETMDTLAEIYYASSYQGQMGSAEFNKALQSWLNEQTGGLLEEQTQAVEMAPETILALATTIYFRAKWSSEFSETATKEGVFHSADGDETCDFMYQSGSRNYYWGDQFSAVGQYLENNGAMWFILPDEGVDVDALLSDDEVMEFLLRDEEWANSKFLTVNLSIPKFDVTSQLDLSTGLQSLGVTDVFDPAVSDYTPMTKEMENIFLSQAKHDARVTIDEEGCTATAYTVMRVCGSAMPPEEEVDFVVDRPFIFTITGADGMPLFVGVVNHPV